MSCPFCMIAAGSPASSDPQILRSPKGSAYLVLSTRLVVAFLDIAPLTPGHVLLCPREHRVKATEMTPAESAALGFWLPVIGNAVMRAVGSNVDSGSWNIIQANGAEAGQTVPHSHFHIIPRTLGSREAAEIGDEERKNLALGEGPRVKIEDEDGTRLSKLIKDEIIVEIKKLKDAGEIVEVAEAELSFRVLESGLKL